MDATQNLLITSIYEHTIPIALGCAVVVFVVLKIFAKHNIIAIIASLLVFALVAVIPLRYGTKMCTNCGIELALTDTVCPLCGEMQDTTHITGTIVCPECDHRINADSVECPYCGAELNE